MQPEETDLVLHAGRDNLSGRAEYVLLGGIPTGAVVKLRRWAGGPSMYTWSALNADPRPPFISKVLELHAYLENLQIPEV